VRKRKDCYPSSIDERREGGRQGPEMGERHGVTKATAHSAESIGRAVGGYPLKSQRRWLKKKEKGSLYRRGKKSAKKKKGVHHRMSSKTYRKEGARKKKTQLR